MKVIFSEDAWDDYLYCQNKNKKTLKRINDLIRDIKRNPEKGIGKPEKLKYELSGYSSRRIDTEHRMVYRVAEEGLLIAQLRFHY